MSAAAPLFCLLALLVCLFQLALICGAPWGEITLGGRWRGALPWRVRLIPLLSILLLLAFCGVVWARAGLGFASWQGVAGSLIWVVVGYTALGVLVHIATPSPRERRTWLPVLLLMLASSGSVALS